MGGERSGIWGAGRAVVGFLGEGDGGDREVRGGEEARERGEAVCCC